MSECKERSNPQGTLEDMQKSLRGIDKLKPLSQSQNSTSNNQEIEPNSANKKQE
jgi:hypothetical protein